MHQPPDIVERLRLLSNGLTPRTESDLMLEAANEILRLHEELDRCRRLMPERTSRLLYEGQG